MFYTPNLIITIVTNRVFILSPALKDFQNLWSYARREFKQSELMIEEIKIDKVCAKIVQLTISAQIHIFGSEAISFSICQVFVYSLFDYFCSSSIERTDKKASCGTSTEPIAFMRFLPAFCFSRSLRLRETSPP